MVVLVKSLAVLIGEMPEMKQQNVHSPVLSYFRNNMTYKRMQNHNCQPRCHFNFRMFRNKGILYPLFLEHYRCQIMHRGPSWLWVLVNLEATKHWFLKEVASSGILTWISPWSIGRKHDLLRFSSLSWSKRHRRDCSLRNSWRLGVNRLQPLPRELDKSTIKVLEK